MTELEQQWALAMAEAERQARQQGRGDVVDYLALRSTNDLARKTAISWLFESFTTKAAEFNRGGASIQITRIDNHSFRAGSSTMIGTELTLKVGIRRITIEAGWPRSPGDGIVRGGGLAHGFVRHFGRKAYDHEVLLIRTVNGTPGWLAVDKHGNRAPLAESMVQKHVAILLE